MRTARSFKDVVESVGGESARSLICTSMDEVIAGAEDLGYPLVVRPSFTMGGLGSGLAHDEEDLRAESRATDCTTPSPTRCCSRRASSAGRSTSSSSCATATTMCGHLLDRERRSRSGAHRRLDHRGPVADPHGPRVPADAGHRHRRHPRGRSRPAAATSSTRSTPHRSDHRHRDEPARLPVVRPGLQGDRLPDREDRREARRGVHAGRDPQRHHRSDSGLVRTGTRLRSREDPALRVREVPRSGSPP